MRFVSPALKHIVFPALSRSGYLRRSVGAGPAIVTYHGAFPAGYEVRNSALDGNLVRPESLRRQLQLLKKHYNVLTPEEFRLWSDGNASVPPRSVLLTCDDTLRNTLTEMVPILREIGLWCLFFATGISAHEEPSMLWYDELYLMLLDGKAPITLRLPESGIYLRTIGPREMHGAWWNLARELSRFDAESRRGFLNQVRDQLGLPEKWAGQIIGNPALASRFLVLDPTGLRQLAASGMTIGAHSLSHPILSKAPDEVAWREISESKIVLEKAIGQTVWAFAYPFGNAETVCKRDLRFAEQAGFRCAFMNVGGGFGAKFERFAVPRIHVTASMSPAEFEAHVAGFYRTMRTKLLGGDELEAAAGA